MVNDIKVARQVAKLLLQINAIILQPKKHFVWAAGWNSPVYCDNRKTLSYPKSLEIAVIAEVSTVSETELKGCLFILNLPINSADICWH